MIDTSPRRPLRSEIEGLLRRQNVEEWLELWWVSQGGTARTQRFELIASVLPFDPAEPIDVLDMCCGPGDLGRCGRRGSRA